MAFKPKAAKPKSQAELAAERSLAEAEEAQRLDKDPESPGIEPDNLTIVLSHVPRRTTVHDYRQAKVHERSQAKASEERQTLLDRLQAKL